MEGGREGRATRRKIKWRTSGIEVGEERGEQRVGQATWKEKERKRQEGQLIVE